MSAQTPAPVPQPLAAISDGDLGDGLMFGWLFCRDEPPVALRRTEIQDALDHGRCICRCW
jgi:hypothetical protein